MKPRSLDTALGLLERFTADHPQWGVRELAVASGLAPSMVQRVLATFHDHGLLERTPARKYRLGVRLWELGSRFRDQFQLADVVLDRLRALAEATGETAWLSLLQGDEAVCVQLCESRESVRVAIHLGGRTPLHAGSRGKVMLAFLPPPRRDALLAAAFPDSPERRDAFTRELEEARRQGWCLTCGERLAGVVGLSAPLFDRAGAVFASVTVGGPAARMPEARIDACRPPLLALARELQTHFQMFA